MKKLTISEDEPIPVTAPPRSVIVPEYEEDTSEEETESEEEESDEEAESRPLYDSIR
jgi:hypothetical protein